MRPLDSQHLQRLPSIVALALQGYQSEQDPLLKAWHLCDFAEMCLRTMVALAIGDWLSALGQPRLPAALRRDIGSRIEQPTMGKWRGMILALCKQPPPGSALPAMYRFVNEVLDPALQGDQPDDSLLALRNRLAHGGGMSRKLAANLVAAHVERVATIVQSMDWLWDVALLVPAAASAPDDLDSAAVGRLLGPTTALQPMTLDDAGRAALGAATPGSGAVVALCENRAINLWPLVHYGSPGRDAYRALDPVPLVYARRSAVGLLLTPLGSDQAAMAEAHPQALAAFEQLIERDNAATASWQVPGFEAELQRDAAHVVGRRSELDTLARAARHTGRGVLWISGPAGMGKSHLLAAFHAEFSPEAGNPDRLDPLLLAYRFKVGDPRCSRYQFLRFAIERLQHRKAQSEPGRQPTVHKLGELLDELHSVIVIVDGIDEIAAVDPEFAADIPIALASRALWICAGRPERGLDHTFSRPGCQAVFPAGMPPLSAVDARAMLLDKIGPLSKRLLRCESDRGDTAINPFVDRVVARAQGLPIYVTYVIGDVLSGRLRAFDRDVALPPSLDAYHATLLDRSAIGSVEQLLTPLLTLLAIAREPMSAKEVHALLVRRTLVTRSDTGLATVHRALLRLAAVLARHDRDAADDHGYTLFHLSLREHVLRSPAMGEALATARQAMNLAASSAHIQPADAARPYLLRHGIAHLAAGAEPDDPARAAALLCDIAYLMVRARTASAGELLADMDRVGGPEIAPWRAFVTRNAHLIDRLGERRMSRPGDRRDDQAHDTLLAGGGSALLQAAVAEADTSPITAAAETWLSSPGGAADLAWLRRLDRPRVPAQDPRVRTLEGHAAPVTGLAMVRALGHEPGQLDSWPASRDQPVAHLLSASVDSTMRLWDLGSGACVRTLQQAVDNLSQAVITSQPRAPYMSDGHGWAIWSADVLDDNRTALGAHGDGSITLWDLHSGTCIASLSGHSGPVWSVRACCDQTRRRAVSAGDDGTVRVWDIDARTCVRRFENPVWMASAAFTADGRRVIAGGGDNLVRVWDPGTGACVHTLAGHKDHIRAVITMAGSPALAISGSHDGTIAVWDLDHGRCLRTWHAHEDGVWSLAGCREHVVSTGQRHDAALWNVATGTRIRTFRGHAGRIWAAADTGDGAHIVTAGQDRAITLWTSGADVGPARATHKGPIHAIAPAPDTSRALTAGDDSTVKLWDLGTRQLLRTFVGHDGPVRAVAWLPDGRFVSAGDDGTLRIWPGFGAFTSSEPCTVLHLGELERITALAVHGNTVLATGTSGAVMGCDVRTTERAVLGSHQGPALCVAFMPAANAGFPAPPARPGNRPGPDNQPGPGNRPGPDNQPGPGNRPGPDNQPPIRAISGGADALVHIWNLETGALETTLRGHSWDVQAVVATSDLVLSACRDSAVYIWNPRTGRHRRAAVRHDPECRVLAALGPYAISAAPDKTLEIWPQSGDLPIACWPAHFAITAVSQASDGTLLCGDAAGELFHFALVQPGTT